jgi:lipopolysaccharide export system protein LptA
VRAEEPASVAPDGSELQLNANTLELDQSRKQVTAKGEAVAQQGDVQLNADTLIAFYRPKQADGAQGRGQEIWQIEAQGQVTIRRPEQTAYADKAVYQLDEKVVRLTGGDLRIETPTATLRAQKFLEYWQGKNVGIAEGKASVQLKDQRQISADSLTAYFQADSSDKLTLKQVIAKPNVVITTPTERIEGEEGVYDAKREFITLAGNVRMTRGTSELTGDRAEVNLRTGVSRILSQSNQKVKARVVPAEHVKGVGGA